MREKRDFAERTKVLESQEVRKKYFLVYEGENTEGIYFDGISEYRNEIGINPLIELVPVIRSYSEEGWSNPKKIIDRMQLNLKEASTGMVSYETLLNWIMEYLSEEGIIHNNRPAAKYMWGILKMICEKRLGVRLDDLIVDIVATCNSIIEYFEKETQWEGIIKDISSIIENRAITYDKSFDKICFIVDRDRKSFISKSENDQYGYVLRKCRENNYGFYLSNPCFEFWLLMHFDEVKMLDYQKILNNPKVSAKRRYTEQELRRIFPGYTKSRYSFKTLISRIDTALLNEKLFCEDEEKLENTIGSRVGLLIEELRE